jgi:hypothetical protein
MAEGATEMILVPRERWENLLKTQDENMKEKAERPSPPLSSKEDEYKQLLDKLKKDLGLATPELDTQVISKRTHTEKTQEHNNNSTINMEFQKHKNSKKGVIKSKGLVVPPPGIPYGSKKLPQTTRDLESHPSDIDRWDDY